MLGIQVVENDRALRSKVLEILGSVFNNAFILNASGRDECFRQLAEHSIDVIIMDIRLKTENGLPLVKEIKKSQPNVFIIMHSMYDSPEYIRAAKDYGADGFLSKNHNSIVDMITLIRSVSDPSFQKFVN